MNNLKKVGENIGIGLFVIGVFGGISVLFHLFFDKKQTTINDDNPRKWTVVDTTYYKDTAYIFTTRIDSVYLELDTLKEEGEPPERN